MTLETLIQQQQIAGAGHAPPPPRALGRRLTVWNGTTINPAYRTLADIATAVWALVPPGAWDAVEWLVKAGEAGTYQATWDPHPLAISGPDKLGQLQAEGQQLGLVVTPYTVVRGDPKWRSAEVAQARALVGVTGRLVLNLEPGSSYAHPTICSPAGAQQYMDDLGLSPEALELCSIPRAEQVRELGGMYTMTVWLSRVQRASWEMYGLVAPTSLRVDVATTYLKAAFPGLPPEQRIPVIQKPELETWAATDYAAAGLQAWHLDGAI